MKVKGAIIWGLVLILLTSLLFGCSKNSDSNALRQSEVNLNTTPYTHPEAIISAKQLYGIINQPNLTVIDTRPRDIYEQGHIPGAICFNVKALNDPNRRGKFTSPKLLSLTIREYGVSSTDHIVVYSDNYSHTALWFFLNMYGLNVQILNGGLEQWQAQGYTLDTGRVRRSNLGVFNLSNEQQKIYPLIETESVANALQQPENTAVIDARSAEEYSGKGHIAGAINITWDQLINEDMTFKNASDLIKLFQDKGITPDKQVIVYSNNAYRASLIYFVLDRLLGYPNVKVYDGYYLYWSVHKPLIKGDI